MTVMFSVAVDIKLPSLACKVKLAFEALQSATMSAVMLPPVLLIFEIVTPLDGLTEMTLGITLPLPPSSVTEAICELVAGEPRVLDSPPAAIMPGGALFVRLKLAVGRPVPMLAITL